MLSRTSPIALASLQARYRTMGLATVQSQRADCEDESAEREPILELQLVEGNLEVDFGSEENASIVYASLAVDKELQPDKVRREMIVCDGKLFVSFEAVEARFLRASFSAFVDVLTLATKTIEAFGKVK